MDSKKLSYTAANSLPLKICKNSWLVNQLNQNYIPPFHVQLIPTNKCNLSCGFCSCSKRNREQELSIDQIRVLIKDLQDLGCEAVTITGGGEPLMYSDIGMIIKMFDQAGISVGLVTNGLLLDKLSTEVFEHITWCRISCSDERKFTEGTKEIISKAIAHGPIVDWAFSYVVLAPESFDPDNLAAYTNFANTNEFTHIRVVSDLIKIEEATAMVWVKEALKKRAVDDRLVIYQGRKEYVHGQERCLISLLKPVIAADGYLYPCCGAQYAQGDEDLDMPEDMRIGRMDQIKELYGKQKYFNGSVCTRCYYKNYNDLLGALTCRISHGRFV